MEYLEFCKQFNISGLNEQQEKAVTKADGATLLLAVPGSGKTTVIVARTGYLMYVANVAPENILTITFTKMAAAEMKARFEKKFHPQRMPAFSTIHSFCVSVLRTCAREKGVSIPQLVPNNEPIIRNIAAKMMPEYPGDATVKALAQEVCKAKNKLMTAEQIKQIESVGLDFYEFYTAYVGYLHDNNLMDFDDQLLMANEMLEDYPDILSRAQQRYRYISVDEAQDTSYVQHLIIRKLVGSTGNIFMVGDEDQSIYGFRGAYPAALLNFENDYPDADVLYMETNYRSDKNIVMAANQFIKKNENRRDKNMQAYSANAGDIKLTRVVKMEDQAKLLLSKIKEQQEQHPDKTMAILYRNNDSAIPLINLMQLNHVGVKTRDATGTFMMNYVVSDILDFMRLALNPRDTEAFGRLYFKMGMYMNAKVAKSIIAAVNDREYQSVFTALKAMYRNKYGFKADNLSTYFSGLATMQPMKGIDFIMYMMDYADSWLKKKIDEGASRENIQMKVALLKMVAMEYQTIGDFLAGMEAIKAYSGSPDSNVTVATMHSSKGLEFDKVILIDMIDGVIPAKSDDENEQDDPEEDARLFYVGATRARHELEIIHCQSRFGEALDVSEFLPRFLGAGKENPDGANDKTS